MCVRQQKVIKFLWRIHWKYHRIFLIWTAVGQKEVSRLVIGGFEMYTNTCTPFEVSSFRRGVLAQVRFGRCQTAWNEYISVFSKPPSVPRVQIMYSPIECNYAHAYLKTNVTCMYIHCTYICIHKFKFLFEFSNLKFALLQHNWMSLSNRSMCKPTVRHFYRQ